MRILAPIAASVTNSGPEGNPQRHTLDQVLRGHSKRVQVRPGVALEGSARAKRKHPGRKPKYGRNVQKALLKVIISVPRR